MAAPAAADDVIAVTPPAPVQQDNRVLVPDVTGVTYVDIADPVGAPLIGTLTLRSSDTLQTPRTICAEPDDAYELVDPDPRYPWFCWGYYRVAGGVTVVAPAAPRSDAAEPVVELSEPGVRYCAVLAGSDPEGVRSWVDPLWGMSAVDSGPYLLPLGKTATIRKEPMPGFAFPSGTRSSWTFRCEPTGAVLTAAFRDVPSSSPYVDEIGWLADRGVTTGWLLADGSREFRPVSPVTREAMAAFLYRLAGSPAYVPPARSPFVDVSTSTRYYPEIAWLFEEQISTGWGRADGSREFRPRAPVARDAMAAFLHRYAGTVLDVDVAAVVPPPVSPFSDVATDDRYYREISWLSGAGISTGWGSPPDVEFRPASPVNRDAMAAFMYRLVQE